MIELLNYPFNSSMIHRKCSRIRNELLKGVFSDEIKIYICRFMVIFVSRGLKIRITVSNVKFPLVFSSLDI